MVNRAVRFFSLLLLTICTATFSAPTNSTSATIKRVEDGNMALSECYKTARNVGAILGSLLLTETLFCCYVLYSWARNFRNNSQNNIKSNSPNEHVNGYPMYTEADEGTAQDQNQQIRNYQPLDPSSPSGRPTRKVEYQPLSKNREKLEKNPGKQLVARLLAKPNKAQAINNTALTVNKDVGGLVYSQPYEDSVSAASQLKIKGTGSVRKKTNKNPPQEGEEEEEDKAVFYHVLEEASQNKSPIEKSIPSQAPEDQNREDVYYYCDSDNPENKKATPSKAIPKISGYSEESKDDVYYSCTLEESNKLSRKNSKKAILPFPQMVKEKSPKANLFVQQPYYHVLDNQSESAKQEPTIKSPPNPLNTNPMINVHMIEEMKNRVANKKYGD